MDFKKTRLFVPLVLLSTLSTAAPGLSAAADSRHLAGPARVVDGDTLQMSENTIRLMGVDAPEKNQRCRTRRHRGVSSPYPCGLLATKWLASKTKNKTVVCKTNTKDRWGRLVGVCTISGENKSLNSQLVSSGWAVAYRKYSKKYIGEEQAAKQVRRGIWAGPFERPEQWRRNYWHYKRGKDRDGRPHQEGRPSIHPLVTLVLVNRSVDQVQGSKNGQRPGSRIRTTITITTNRTDRD